MEYIKVDDTSFKKIKQEETIYNVQRLKEQKGMYLEQKRAIDKRIMGIDVLLSEAKKIGVGSQDV